MDYTSLYTPVSIPSSPWKIGYKDSILLLGSCFADSMSGKLHEHYFRVEDNPFGVLYNPSSIATAIAMASQGVRIEPQDLVEHGGMWHSMVHHGQFSDVDKHKVLERCNASIEVLRNALQHATVITITFGTAWVYEYEGKVVGNCHKLPANSFLRRRMTVEEIVAMWQPIIESMPHKHWIFTVSPIRHIKDGLHENHISKAVLLQAVDALASSPHRLIASSPYRLSYFPSYEIMLDELRDYRFYAEDMVHPSELAVDYIWQRFVDAFMTEDTRKEMKTLHQLWCDRQHKLLHPDSPAAISFQNNVARRLDEFQKRYPWIE